MPCKKKNTCSRTCTVPEFIPGYRTFCWASYMIYYNIHNHCPTHNRDNVHSHYGTSLFFQPLLVYDSPLWTAEVHFHTFLKFHWNVTAAYIDVADW